MSPESTRDTKLPLKYNYTLGVGTTGFVLALSWLSAVTAGHTKRITVNAIMLSAYCIGNAAGPFMWQASYKPRSVPLSLSQSPESSFIIAQ